MMQRYARRALQGAHLAAGAVLLFFSVAPQAGFAQTPAPPADSVAQQMQELKQLLSRAEAQLASSQQQLLAVRQQLDQLQQQVAAEQPLATSPNSAGSSPSSPSPQTSDSNLAQAVQEIGERQDVQQSEIAVHEQSKVESESKFPIKLNGLILLTGLISTRQPDVSAAPTFVLPGNGATSFSLQQSIFGLDARGPHLLGARSSADVRVDFFGSGSTSGYGGGTPLLRLRTAHAALDWDHAQIFFSLDRTILSPETPTSLTAVAYPALAWSGSLWSWNPQVGARYDLAASDTTTLRLEGAIINAQDPPAVTSYATGSYTPLPSLSERSGTPGGEARLALRHSNTHGESEFGVGGYFGPHRTGSGSNFNAWAGTVDFRLALPARFQFSGNLYRGAALGGLGAGAFKDLIYRTDAQGLHVRTLDDVGGWAQLKQRVTEKLEWNLAYGIDNAFARQLRPYAGANPYVNLARNQTFSANTLYSPRASLLFSLEYRRLASSPVNAPTIPANVYGLAAAYKF